MNSVYNSGTLSWVHSCFSLHCRAPCKIHVECDSFPDPNRVSGILHALGVNKNSLPFIGSCEVEVGPLANL